MPVWSLNALDGIFELADPPLFDEVSLAELVELHATAVVATSTSTPTVARRVFHDAEPNAPPWYRS
jgi:hypothetical protein